MNHPTDEDERTRRLAAFAESRSQHDRNRVVESFMPLADFFAKRYFDRPVEPEELRQVARMGLVKSVDRFDPAYGVTFATYAGRTIDGELKHWLRDRTESIRLPRSIKENTASIGAANRVLEQRYGRPPTVPELAEHTNLDVDVVLEALDAAANTMPLRLDGALGDEGELHDVLSMPDSAFSQSELEMFIADLLNDVPDRESEIIRLRFFDQLSQQEIASRLGVSQMQVSRLLRSTLSALQRRVR